MTAARLDVELVRRGLARSRRGAAELVSAGRVEVSGAPARKASQAVGTDDELVVLGEPDRWVSRAAHKLLGALADLDGAVDPAGRLCLDAGASTGGFTQVLLEGGARHVVAVDVGHRQMAPEVRDDARVTVREGLNVRAMTVDDVVTDGERPTLVVADISFISLTYALPALLAVCAPHADLLVLVKPQFEVGRTRLGRGGVVSSPELREEAVRTVAGAAVAAGAQVRAVLPSRLVGESGNQEYVLHLVAGAHHPAVARMPVGPDVPGDGDVSAGGDSSSGGDSSPDGDAAPDDGAAAVDVAAGSATGDATDDATDPASDEAVPDDEAVAGAPPSAPRVALSGAVPGSGFGDDLSQALADAVHRAVVEGQPALVGVPA